MDIILVPGLWLDASSWGQVAPILERAGHTLHPLTMPGVGEPAESSGDVGISDWVDAVVSEIDRLDGDVVLVGHSGGGNVVYGAATRRPDRVAHVVFLDTFPPGEGGSISEFPVVDSVVPFPGWDFFDDFDVADIDEGTRARIAARVSSVPARVPTDPISLGGTAARALPSTMITNTVREAEVREIIAAPPKWAAELAALDDLRIIDLRRDGDAPGHWPQFTKPDLTGAAIVEAIAS